MTKFHIMIVSSALSLLIAACAPTSSQTQRSSEGGAGEPLRTFQVSDLKDHPLTCSGTQGTCRESVGQLVTLRDSGYESCTFTLVSPTIILTAAHCVNWSHVNKDYSIQDGCFARFAPRPGQNPNDPELQPIACSAIIESMRVGAELTTDVKSDYAYIELAKPSSRKPMTVSSSPFAGRAPLVNLTVIDPGAKTDEMRSFECEQDPNLQLSAHRRAHSTSILFPDCPIHFGNSGGPIFDSKTDEVLGVVSFIDQVIGNKTSAVGSRAPSFLR